MSREDINKSLKRIESHLGKYGHFTGGWQSEIDITNIREALQPVDNKWQPIETAPRDGTLFIGYNPIVGVRRNITWSPAREDFDINGWSCTNRNWTHWMPQEELPSLPLPPKELKKMITTTLNKIREHSPCKESWIILNKELGSDYGGDSELKFSQILDILDLNDTLWCLRSICPEHDKEVRLYAADCAEHVLHIYEKRYPNDTRARDCIQGAKDFVSGKITRKELDALKTAYAAADADAAYAAYAAYAAAYAAAAYAAAAAAADAAYAAAYAAAAYAAAAAAEKQFQAKLLIERFG